jgi:hypothetical protein
MTPGIIGLTFRLLRASEYPEPDIIVWQHDDMLVSYFINFNITISKSCRTKIFVIEINN